MKLSLRKILVSSLLGITALACSNLTENQKKYEKYNLSAKIVTSKGDINLFLYPTEAPLTVANFIFLAKNNFYDDLIFHRVEQGLIQGGDPLGNGTGGTSYVIPNETDTYLKYNYDGMVGMANSGVDTNSSQFFITKQKLPVLNGKYTIFGSLKSFDDLINTKAIQVGDQIEDIIITGDNADTYLDNFKAYTAKWQQQLNKEKKIEKLENKNEQNIKQNIKDKQDSLDEQKIKEKRIEQIKIYEAKNILKNYCNSDFTVCSINDYDASKKSIVPNIAKSDMKKIVDALNTVAKDKNIKIYAYSYISEDNRKNLELSAKRLKQFKNILEENNLDKNITVIKERTLGMYAAKRNSIKIYIIGK